MKTGVLLINFGEPDEPNHDVIVEYLTNIFYANASIEEGTVDDSARGKSRTLAERRAPELLQEYEAIGGSPLTEQSKEQAIALARELRDRGYAVDTYVAMQFLDPTIDDALIQMLSDDVDHIIGLPVYPLCGPSTTVAALETLHDSIDSAGVSEEVTIEEITGWHRHPRYNRLRADHIATFARERDLRLTDSETVVVFSAHGTPQYYLDRGSKYVTYVEEYCATIASVLGVDDYTLGYQNHENRGVEWTAPAVDTVIDDIDGERVVVEPVSFMHEQSETLSELDIDLRTRAEANGVEFHRVSIPHDDPRFAAVLADLVEPFVAGFDPAYYQLRQCRCKATTGTVCLNAR